MTPPTTQFAPHLLDPDTRAVLLASVYDALPIPPNAAPEEITAKRHAAKQYIAALDPADPIEAMLVARHVAAHYAFIAAIHEVMQGGHPPNLHTRYQRNAIALHRMAASLLRDLQRRQAARARPPAEQPAPGPSPTPAPRPQQTQAAAQPARPATPAPRSTPAEQRPAPTPPPAPGTSPALTDADLRQLMAEAEARLETTLAALAA
jgi:hypothetical protein